MGTPDMLDPDALLALPETARKDAIVRLMRSLPRHQLSEVHSELTAYLKRDILGALPREIAFNVFMRLDTASLLTCSIVNRQWHGLVNDQGLWHHMCNLARLEADTSTTWADVSAQRDHLAWEARGEYRAPPRGHLALTDEGWDEDGVVADGEGEADDVLRGNSEGYGGIRRLVTERVGVGGAPLSPVSASGSTAGWADLPGPRRPSFQPVRKPTQLPLFLLPGGTGNALPGAGAGSGCTPSVRKRESLSSLVATITPLPSHMPDPTPKPRPNYRHLYLVHDILAARSRTTQRAPALPRPRVLDSRSSGLAGGLDGHREGIYCLMVYNDPLAISALGHPVEWEAAAEPTAKRLDGRRWLISGSRDKTLRLWDTQRDRVVKVYTTEGDGGHTGSVLTLHARPYAPGRSGGRMVSGGSDGRVVVWDLESGDVQGTIQASVRGMSVLCVRFDDRRIVCCSKDCSIRTFDAQTLEPLLVIGGPTPNVGVQPENALVNNPPMTADDIEGHRAAVNAVALTDRYIISASGDRTLRAWDVNTGELLLKLEAHSRGIASLDVDVQRGIAVTGSSDWGIREFDLCQHGLDFSPLPPPERPGTPDDEMAALEVDDDEDDIMAGHPSPVEKRVTPTIFDGGLEFRAGRGCCVVTRARLEMANATSAGQETPPLQSGSRPALSMCLNCGKRGHTDLVRALWLGKKVVISGSYDSTIKVWDRTTGLLITDLADMHTGRIFCVVGDKTKVISSGIDGRIVIWDYAVGLDTSFIRP